MGRAGLGWVGLGWVGLGLGLGWAGLGWAGLGWVGLGWIVGGWVGGWVSGCVGAWVRECVGGWVGGRVGGRVGGCVVWSMRTVSRIDRVAELAFDMHSQDDLLGAAALTCNVVLFVLNLCVCVFLEKWFTVQVPAAVCKEPA